MRIDATVDLSAINTPLTEELRRLAPFGQENPKPMLAARGVELISESAGAQLVDLAVGETQVVMIFNKDLEL